MILIIIYFNVKNNKYKEEKKIFNNNIQFIK